MTLEIAKRSAALVAGSACSPGGAVGLTGQRSAATEADRAETPMAGRCSDARRGW